MRASPSGGYHEIAAELRSEWLAGPWQGGRRCPSHVELQQRFKTTEVTVQRAMALLSSQGFIETRPRSGRFLAGTPPHARQYGLVFPGHPGQISSWLWTRQFVALYVAEAALNAEGACEIRPYFDVTPESGGKGYARLMQDIAARCLGGVLFSYTPHELAATPLLAAPPVPVVLPNRMAAGAGLVVGHSAVEDLETRVYALLRERGCRRLGLLTPMFVDPEAWLARLRAAGFQAERVWFQGVDLFKSKWMRHALEVILHGNPQTRPDALFISDDHLVEPAARELSAMGVRIPGELLVVGHWNFPLHYSGEVPVELIGVDAREQLRAGVRAIAAATQRGAAPTGDVGVPARCAADLREVQLPRRYRGRSVEQTVALVQQECAARR